MYCHTTGAPKLANSDLCLKKRATVPIKTRFSRNKSLLISFAAPVVTH